MRDIGVKLAVFVGKRRTVLAVHVEQHDLRLFEVEHLLQDPCGRAAFSAAAVAQKGHVLRKHLGPEHLDLEVGIQCKSAEGKALGVLAAAQQLIETPEDGLEVRLDGDPNIVAYDRILVDPAHKAPRGDFAQKLYLHDELRLYVRHGDFLAADGHDESDDRAFVHRYRDVGAELSDSVGPIFEEQI